MLQPLGDRIAVKLLESEKTTASGLHVQNTNERIQRGEVVGVGEVENVKVGDTVCFVTNAGIEVKLRDSEGVIVLKLESVLGVIS